MNHKNINLSEYLNLIYSATYMPMHYLHDGKIQSTYPQWAFPIQKFKIYEEIISQNTIHFEHHIIDNYLYIGIVRNLQTKECVITGPISISSVSSKTIKSLIMNYADDEASFIKMEEYFRRTPVFSLSRLLNIMAMINVAMNHEIINIAEMAHINNTNVEKEVKRSSVDSLMERKENGNYHDTYYFEQEYFGYIERGDIEGLKTAIKMIPSLTVGLIASDTIRQAKNIFITSITLATRHAITGGLDIETAYQLSDSYIQEMEKMSDIYSINMLASTAIFDFTTRVADAKIPSGMSQDIFSCVQYISNHVNQNYSVEQLAYHFGFNRSTLSKKFKRETGYDISSFIMLKKLEEAKNLLCFSDRTISEISEYLCFSSQAYFQNMFKKQYGITPRNYRLQNQ